MKAQNKNNKIIFQRQQCANHIAVFSVYHTEISRSRDKYNVNFNNQDGIKDLSFTSLEYYLVIFYKNELVQAIRAQIWLNFTIFEQFIQLGTLIKLEPMHLLLYNRYAHRIVLVKIIKVDLEPKIVKFEKFRE